MTKIRVAPLAIISVTIALLGVTVLSPAWGAWVVSMKRDADRYQVDGCGAITPRDEGNITGTAIKNGCEVKQNTNGSASIRCGDRLLLFIWQDEWSCQELAAKWRGLAESVQ